MATTAPVELTQEGVSKFLEGMPRSVGNIVEPGGACWQCRQLRWPLLDLSGLAGASPHGSQDNYTQSTSKRKRHVFLSVPDIPLLTVVCLRMSR